MRTVDFRSDLIVRWPDPHPSHIPILKQAGVQAVILPKPEPAFAEAGLATLSEAELKAFPLDKLPTDPGAYAAFTGGRWPGVTRGPAAGSDIEVASASREPWIDSNIYWVAYLRALYPKAVPVLAYEANEAAGWKKDQIVPFETAQLALAEARLMGGNCILSLDPQFRKALLANDAKAVAAWKQLGVTAQWFGEHKTLFGVELQPTILEIVEPGDATAEIANLLIRRGGSPRLVAEVPARLPAGTLTLVTTAMKPPTPAVAARLLDHVATGGVTLVTDAVSEKPWWRSSAKPLKQVKTQSDRVFYSLGRGTIVAYNSEIVDPSEHALDIIDLVGHPRRSVRIWNANSTIAVSSPGVVHLMNYAGRGRNETQVRIQGVYKTATVLRPGREPVKLEALRRGTTTEVFVPDPALISTVVFR